MLESRGLCTASNKLRMIFDHLYLKKKILKKDGLCSEKKQILKGAIMFSK